MTAEPATLRPTDLAALRMQSPERIATALAARRRAAFPPPTGQRLLVVAADHPGRGALDAGGGGDMSDRLDLIDRCVTALARPGVSGFLGTADLVEDLALLGALEGKVVLGSMNRGGLAGSVFEIDDRFTGYDAAGIAAARLDGGKMLLRLDRDDPATAGTLQACAGAVGDLAARGLVAMVEPFEARRVDGRVVNDLTEAAVVRSVAVASGLASTSAYTWLKVPYVEGMEQVAAASTLPLFVLGGAADAAVPWDRVLALPSVRGLVSGRALLYPPGGDVAGTVDRLVELL